MLLSQHAWMSKKLFHPWPLYDFMSQYTWNLYPNQIFYKCFGFCNLVCDGHTGQAWWCDLSLACCMSHTFDCAVLVWETLIFVLYRVSSAWSPSVSLCHKEQRVNDPGNKEKLCSGTELLHLMYILFQHLVRNLHLLFRTTSRIQTFYDGAPDSPPGVCHIPMEPAFCPSTSQVVSESAKALGLKLHPAVTCVTIEGPRFSSLAESQWYRKIGGHVVNMTSVPEVTHWICYYWCKENVQWNGISRLHPLPGISSRRGLKTGSVFLLGWKGAEAPAALISLEGGILNHWSGKCAGEKWALNFQQA